MRHGREATEGWAALELRGERGGAGGDDAEGVSRRTKTTIATRLRGFARWLVKAQRRTVYLLVLWTGLRRSEIEKLQWGDLVLDGARPAIQLRASATKSRRADRLPIHAELKAALVRWRQAVGKSATDPQACVFTTIPSMKAFKADLAAAGISYRVAGKGVVDFHALRKTYSTLLAAAQVPQRIRQAAMRHADPRLTETTYMDEEVLPVFEHVSGLPPLGQSGPSS